MPPRKALAQARKLLKSESIDEVRQGLALIEGLALEPDGRIVWIKKSEIHRRIRMRYRGFVAVELLRIAGRLDLTYSKYLQDARGLEGLTGLEGLKITNHQLRDLAPLAGLTRLQTLDLRWCRKLTDLSALEGLDALSALDLRNCKALPKAVRKAHAGRGAVVEALRALGLSPRAAAG